MRISTERQFKDRANYEKGNLAINLAVLIGFSTSFITMKISDTLFVNHEEMNSETAIGN